MLPWYIGTHGRQSAAGRARANRSPDRKAPGEGFKSVRRIHDLTLGDLLEGIVLHAFDGKCPFNQASLDRIRELKKFYGLELDSTASHRLKEVRSGQRKV